MKNINKIRTRFKNMMLTQKMLLVYFFFAGIFCVVAVLAFYISMKIFEKRLYEASVQELDYYVQSVRESLEEVEDKSYEMSMDIEIQNLFSDLKQTETTTSEYNRMLTNLRWRLANENNSRSAVRAVRYMDSHGTIVESAAYSWKIPEEAFDELTKTIEASSGEAVFYGPTKECGYLLCGRKIQKWTDMSLDRLGTVILICDIEQIIAKNKKQLEADHASLFVYSDENMIFQDIGSELPQLPSGQDGCGYKVLNYQNQQYFMCYLSPSGMGWTYVNFFPYSDIYGQITWVRRITFLCFFIVFVLLLLLMNRITAVITKPLEILTQSMRVVETGDFQGAKLIPWDAEREDEVGLLTQEFRVMLDKIDILIRENYEKQLLLTDTKYKMLQAQINPHFLHNTLNTIHWMIRTGKNEDAGRMIVELGMLLRCRFEENPYTTVEEEVSMLKSYIEIQKFRYEGRARFVVELIGTPEEYIIPRMMLQPLVENAIFYGADVMKEICFIRITIVEKSKEILFEVRDNGPGIKEEELEKVRDFTIKPKGHGIGIKNIYERLNMTYKAFQFTIDSSEGEGTVIRICVPKKRNRGEEDDVQAFNCR